jgi:DNA-directed RNA polymerase specialized sigma24 family protein
LAQEVILKAWAAFDRFEPGTRARPWLLTITRNVFLSGRRRKRNVILMSDLDDDDD